LSQRDQNEALVAAGFPVRFAELPVDEIPPEIDAAVTQMMAQHEPFPLIALTLDGTIVRSNQAARALFAAFVAEPAALPAPLDMYSLLFDLRLSRPFVVGWERWRDRCSPAFIATRSSVPTRGSRASPRRRDPRCLPASSIV
jgi:hypothetical protein